jgi:diacylglycerol O-acyltransferase
MRTTSLNEPISAFDALMIASEDDPRSRSSFLVMFTLDQTPDWERLVSAFERASRRTLRLRQRAVFPSVRLATPRWVVDPDFDLAYHLRRVRVPEPGDHRQLLDWAAPLLMAALDRSRPLWEAHLVEGLAGGQAAVVMKFNHALFDGLGGIQAMAHLFDLEPAPRPRPLPRRPIPYDVVPGDILRADVQALPFEAAAALRAGVSGLRGAGGSLLRGALHPGGAVSALGARARSAGSLLGSSLVPGAPLLRGRSAKRRLFTVDVGLDELKRAAKAAGGTLNSAYLSAVIGAVGEYHRRLGAPIDAFPLAFPVSLRRPDDPDTSNRWTGAPIAAPAGVTDPLGRTGQVDVLAAEARADATVNALEPLLPLVSRLPRPLVAAMAQRATATDVQASNVPGWQVPVYLAGAAVNGCYPFGPLPGVAMMVVLISVCGTCHVGVNYDPAAVTEPAVAEEAFLFAFEEVIDMGREGSNHR